MTLLPSPAAETFVCEHCQQALPIRSRYKPRKRRRDPQDAGGREAVVCKRCNREIRWFFRRQTARPYAD